MRRARIKAVATVPVRRKAAAPDGPAAEPSEQADAKAPEIVPEVKLESNVEPDPTPIKQLEEEKVVIPEVPEKRPVSPVKEREYLEPIVLDDDVKPEAKHDVQQVARTPSPQRPLPASSTIEASPVKTMQSRSCFMRPTPRLDGAGGRVRRNSVQGSGASASESEDDSTRRSVSIAPSRARNDSICSVQSLKDTSNSGNVSKLNLGQKRRMVVSESARKLAEARREFNLKYENKAPDKTKLTMYDLIYYNPTTNPMKPKPANRPAARKISVCLNAEKKKAEEEVVEEPAEMLVPQVKVGPNGQLIIDEQSLVIDQYKALENIDRSDILIDEDTTGNGFYKRRAKSKDWSKWETVKFYKALNTYGTDFLLMQSVFPKRTRQELKLKYKKEERINQSLIEKALQYQEFDTDALDKDLASFEETERRERASKKPKPTTVKSSASKRNRKRCQGVAEEVNCENENDERQSKSSGNSTTESSGDDSPRRTIAKKLKTTATNASKAKKRPMRKTAKNDAISSANSCDDEGTNENSDSEQEVYKTKPTRSGRVSKKPKKVDEKAEVSDPKTNGRPEQMRKIADSQEIKKEESSNKAIEVFDTQSTENGEVSDDTSVMMGITEIVHGDNETSEINKIQNDEDDMIIEVLDASDDSDNKALEMQDMTNDEAGILDQSAILEIVENSSNDPDIPNDDEQTGAMPSDEQSENPNELLETLGATSNLTPKEFDELTADLPNMKNLKPGSLVVVKKDSADEPGKHVLQVYIVSADYNVNNPNYKDSLLPLELSPDILETVTNYCIKGIEPENTA